MALRGAIIGFGKVAEHGHVPGWRGSRDFEIVAVMDPSAERRAAAQATLPDARVYETIPALLSAEQLDFVDIASPPAFHAAAAVAAAENGLHVLCEKPITTAISDYLPARDAVDRAGVVFHPVHNWKYSEAFRHVADVLARGDLGLVRRVRLQTDRNGWAASDGDWRAQSSIAGGGILVDHGWHNFYLLLAIAGATPRRVLATTEKRRYRDADVEDTAHCVVEFEGVVGEIALTWAAAGRRTCWTIEGERGTLVIEDDLATLSMGGEVARSTLAASLSQGSHHPEWFPGVAAELTEEIKRPTGAGRAEAETCLRLLVSAYRSAREGGVETALALIEGASR